MQLAEPLKYRDSTERNEVASFVGLVRRPACSHRLRKDSFVDFARAPSSRYRHHRSAFFSAAHRRLGARDDSAAALSISDADSGRLLGNRRDDAGSQAAIPAGTSTSRLPAVTDHRAAAASTHQGPSLDRCFSRHRLEPGRQAAAARPGRGSEQAPLWEASAPPAVASRLMWRVCAAQAGAVPPPARD